MRAPPASNRPTIGRAVLERHVLDLGDLLRMRLAKRAAEHGEILGEDEDRAAVDRAPAGDHAVARNLGLLHAEIVAAMLDEHVELLERVVIEQQFDALARGELALGVLRGDALLAAAETGALAASVEAGKHRFHRWLRNLKLLPAQRSTTAGRQNVATSRARMTAVRDLRRSPPSGSGALLLFAGQFGARFRRLRLDRRTFGRAGR